MHWLEWVVFALRILILIGGLLIAFRANRHYRNGEYQQAIYNMLFVIFIAVGMR